MVSYISNSYYYILCLSEDEGLGEADSFLGQSPPSSQPGPAVGMATPSSGYQGSAAPPMGLGPRPPTSSMSPLVPTSHVPASNVQMSSAPPPPNSSGKLHVLFVKVCF